MFFLYRKQFLNIFEQSYHDLMLDITSQTTVH